MYIYICIYIYIYNAGLTHRAKSVYPPYVKATKNSIKYIRIYFPIAF